MNNLLAYKKTSDPGVGFITNCDKYSATFNYQYICIQCNVHVPSVQQCNVVNDLKL